MEYSFKFVYRCMSIHVCLFFQILLKYFGFKYTGIINIFFGGRGDDILVTLYNTVH